jgi:hypothetical protein
LLYGNARIATKRLERFGCAPAEAMRPLAGRQ